MSFLSITSSLTPHNSLRNLQQRGENNDPSAFQQLLLTEVTRSLHKSIEVFNGASDDGVISSQYNDLAGELLAQLTAKVIAEKLTDKLVSSGVTVEVAGYGD